MEPKQNGKVLDETRFGEHIVREVVMCKNEERRKGLQLQSGGNVQSGGATRRKMIKHRTCRQGIYLKKGRPGVDEPRMAVL